MTEKNVRMHLRSNELCTAPKRLSDHARKRIGGLLN